MNANEKTCRKCGATKHETSFPRNKRVQGGRDRMCKACWSDYAYQRRERKINEDQARYEEAGRRNQQRRQYTYTPPKSTTPQNGAKFYALLSALPREARRAEYMRLVKLNHPDVGGTHEAMIELNEAYRLLK